METNRHQKIVSKLMKMETQVKTEKEPSKQIELHFVRLKISEVLITTEQILNTFLKKVIFGLF